ncbi:MAG TPA: ABC transporter ATP-binding protein [Gammaproteobacteria bacterium]|nr:ABC transporter ATP-binding protein [Gammaproteobacteria bacterium]
MDADRQPDDLKSVNVLLWILAKKCNLILIALGISLLSLAQALLITIPRFIGYYLDTHKTNSAILIFVLFIAVAIVTFLARIVVSEIQQRARRFSKLYIYKMALYKGRTDQALDPGRLESYIGTISFSARAIFSDSLVLAVTVLSLIILISAFLAKLSFIMSFCYLTASLLFIPLSYYFAKRNTLNIDGCVSLTANVAQTMIDVLSKLAIVRAFRTEKQETGFIDETLEKEESKYKDTQFLTEGNTLIQNIALAILNGGLILYAVALLKNGSLQVGDILFIVSVLLLAGNTLSGVGERLLAFFEYRNRMQSALTGVEEMLYQKKRIHLSAKFVAHAPHINIVELENGVFLMGENGQLSRPFNLVIKRGIITLITGSNGCGKSSLLRVLIGELPLVSGELRWFIRPNKVVYSAQMANLFNRSLLENITYGSKTTIFNDQFNALLPKTLSHRLHETVGSQSMRLSGGEKQIIANLRAMHMPGEIYIFDEPTAHLDASAQVLFYESLKKIFSGKSIIIVDHNPIAKNFCEEVIDANL